jgi:hypothetical protein
MRTSLKWMKTSMAAISAALALAAAPAASAALVNGSFENGGFVDEGNDTMSPPVASTVITGWTVVTDTIAWIGPKNPFGLTASDGDYFLDLTNYQPGAPFGGVTQSVATTPGATYRLSFDLGSGSFWGLPSAITASAAGASQTFTSTLTGLNNWEAHSLDFVATGPSTLITLQGVTGFNYIGLDHVALTFVSGPGVPEPATWTMMIAGFAGLGLARRRARRKQGLAAVRTPAT